MTMTDTIADMITRIRNGSLINKSYVLVPHSKFGENAIKVLKEEGFIRDYETIEENKRHYFRVFLMYYAGKKKAITEIKKVSKPGSRIYVEKDKIPVIKNGTGIAVLSTSKGVMSNKKAKEQGLGGELLFYVW
jgi:small subunit ribosomal protein S8